jgi:hypothetical protein
MDPPSSSSLGHLEAASVPVPPVGLLAALAFLSWPRAARTPLKGRHVFITGGSSSIGLAMATAATREGARVSILARNLAGLEEARATIQRDSGRDDVAVHAADVRDAGAVVRALREAGPVNVLVSNHGMFMPQELERQDMDEIKWMVDIHSGRSGNPQSSGRVVWVQVRVFWVQGSGIGFYAQSEWTSTSWAPSTSSRPRFLP